MKNHTAFSNELQQFINNKAEKMFQEELAVLQKAHPLFDIVKENFGWEEETNPQLKLEKLRLAAEELGKRKTVTKALEEVYENGGTKTSTAVNGFRYKVQTISTEATSTNPVKKTKTYKNDEESDEEETLSFKRYAPPGKVGNGNSLSSWKSVLKLKPKQDNFANKHTYTIHPAKYRTFQASLALLAGKTHGFKDIPTTKLLTYNTPDFVNACKLLIEIYNMTWTDLEKYQGVIQKEKGKSLTGQTIPLSTDYTETIDTEPKIAVLSPGESPKIDPTLNTLINFYKSTLKEDPAVILARNPAPNKLMQEFKFGNTPDNKLICQVKATTLESAIDFIIKYSGKQIQNIFKPKEKKQTHNSMFS